jgi:nicotinic acid mononucleotide adenylyltransferase
MSKYFIITNGNQGKPSRLFDTMEQVEKELDKKCTTVAAAEHKINSLMVRQQDEENTEYSYIIKTLESWDIQDRRIAVLSRNDEPSYQDPNEEPIAAQYYKSK